MEERVFRSGRGSRKRFFRVKRADRVRGRFLAAAPLTAVLVLIAACSTQEPFERKAFPVSEPGTAPADESRALAVLPAAAHEWFPLSQWNGNPVVTTHAGAVEGFPAGKDVLSWKGIPYALPPLGEYRWRAPVDHPPWDGIFKAERFGGIAAQPNPLARGRVIGSEDCLTLNLWRPADGETGLPVYVFIHGGGNSLGGSGIVPDYDGAVIAGSKHLVFLTMNYRVGPFGWFTHPALREGADPLDASGNYGTLDIIKALEWIRDNIAAFGGDPGNVPIAGESAGGFNVYSLLVSPKAQGLFHRGIVQSGYLNAVTIADGDEAADRVLLALLVRDKRAATPEDAERIAVGMTNAEIAAYLRGASTDEIMACFDPGPMGMLDFPYLFPDGEVIAREGFDLIRAGTPVSRVPLIIGSNRDEVRLFLGFGKLYRKNRELFRLASDIGSDTWRSDSVDLPAKRLSSVPGNPPVYTYLFQWGTARREGGSVMPGRWGDRLGACHSLDVPFFLGNNSFNGKFLSAFIYTRRNEGGRRSLSEAMMEYAAFFASTGDANGTSGGASGNSESRRSADLPYWPSWDPAAGKTLSIVFDADYDARAIFLTDAGSTREEVLERARNAADPELFAQALDILEDW